MAERVTMRASISSDPNYGMLQVITTRGYESINVSFNPSFNTLENANRFFSEELAGNLGGDHDLLYFAPEIASFVLDILVEIRSRGLQCGLRMWVFWKRGQASQTGLESLAAIPVDKIGSDYTSVDSGLGVLSSLIIEGDRPVRGFSKSEIEMLNKERFVGEDNNKDKSCSVCLDDFRDGAVTKLSPCSHEFHNKCIVKWLRRNVTCPFCRSRCVV